MPVLPGRPLPLGVELTTTGAYVSLVSASADAVTLCLIADDGAEERLPLTQRDFGVWHGFVPGLLRRAAVRLPRGRPVRPRAGAALRPQTSSYSIRTPGPSPATSATDPRSTATRRTIRRTTAASTPPAASRWASSSTRAFDWGADDHPRTPLADSIIYEVHVKGFTMQHPDVPAALRGTYAGLAHPAALQHLVDLGVTAVELLPVHHSVTEPSVHAHGLVNYWGYNTLGFFAPHAAYSAAVRAGRPGGQVAEFKSMVQALHAAGLEVILDVVFNHTAEAGAEGPTLSFRGLDNTHYYRLDPSDPARYVDTTGCGNSLDADSVVVLRLIMDSLRYWVQEMHVDGFRFDLTPTLGRESGVFERTASFFDIIAQDPVLSLVKLDRRALGRRAGRLL